MAARDFGPKPKLDYLPIARLSVDMAYQRSLESERSKALIVRIAAEFDWALFGTVMVAPLEPKGEGPSSRHGGSFELMDGQHRVAGARAAGIKDVPPTIIQAPTLQQRARIFAASNSQRVAMHPFSLHHANVRAGDPIAVAIAQLCAAADVEVPRYPMHRANLKPNQTLALGALKKLAAEGAPSGADGNGAVPMGGGVRTLSILRAAFPEEAGSLQAHIIMGLREWLRAHAGCDDLAVARTLQDYSLERLEKRIFSIGLNGARRAAGVVAVLNAVVPAAITGRKPALQLPSEDQRKAAFTPRNADLLARAKQFAEPPPFDPGRMQVKPRAAAPIKGRGT